MCSTTSVDTNLRVAAQKIEQAADKGAKLIVLPEEFALFAPSIREKLEIREHPGQGKIQDFLSDMARRFRVWLVGGTLPLFSEDENKVYAASFVYNDLGEQVARYNKVHLFDAVVEDNKREYLESFYTKPGNGVTVIETPLGRLGVAVCYDLRFPELFRIMHHHNVEIIALPSAFIAATGKAHWEVLLRSRAIENLCFVLGSNQSAVHENTRESHGHSMIVNPWGEVIASCQNEGPALAIAEVDLNFLNETRLKFPALRHSRVAGDALAESGKLFCHQWWGEQCEKDSE